LIVSLKSWKAIELPVERKVRLPSFSPKLTPLFWVTPGVLPKISAIAIGPVACKTILLFTAKSAIYSPNMVISKTLLSDRNTCGLFAKEWGVGT
jgi:hypothetical protein